MKFFIVVLALLAGCCAKPTSVPPQTWEHIVESCNDPNGNGLDRIKVPGGWVYRSGTREYMVFVPEPPAESK